jgi:hypothetical protein
MNRACVFSDKFNGSFRSQKSARVRVSFNAEYDWQMKIVSPSTQKRRVAITIFTLYLLDESVSARNGWIPAWMIEFSKLSFLISPAKNYVNNNVVIENIKCQSFSNVYDRFFPLRASFYFLMCTHSGARSAIFSYISMNRLSIRIDQGQKNRMMYIE